MEPDDIYSAEAKLGYTSHVFFYMGNLIANPPHSKFNALLCVLVCVYLSKFSHEYKGLSNLLIVITLFFLSMSVCSCIWFFKGRLTLDTLCRDLRLVCECEQTLYA